MVMAGSERLSAQEIPLPVRDRHDGTNTMPYFAHDVSIRIGGGFGGGR